MDKTIMDLEKNLGTLHEMFKKIRSSIPAVPESNI